MTRDEAVELIVAALPYPAQIRDWDTTSESDALRFTWRGNRFRFSYATSWLCEEVDDCFLRGSDLALLVEHLVKIVYVNRPLRGAATQPAGDQP
jgi:hypothetical protein